MTLRSDSGSSCSPSSVEPTTSQNTIVTVLRTSGASGEPSRAPQTEQKFAPSGLSAPQLGQDTATVGVYGAGTPSIWIAHLERSRTHSVVRSMSGLLQRSLGSSLVARREGVEPPTF